MGAVTIRETSYKDFGRCIEVSNGVIDAYITVDVGPRVIRFGFCGRENELCELNGFSKEVPGGVWNIWGGHRLWHSPEHEIRTYVPDNEPVEWKIIGNGVALYQKEESSTGIKKEIEFAMCENFNKVKIVHRLINKGLWPIELAAWGITMLAAGGRQIIPMPKGGSGLLPNRSIALWPYSKMNDKRLYWGDRYITLKQDKNIHEPFKMGIANEEGWAAYVNHKSMFIKRIFSRAGERYPDFGSSYETYVSDYMVEMESLSPLTLLKPDCSVTHAEEWELVDNVDIGEGSEEEIQSVVDKYII